MHDSSAKENGIYFRGKPCKLTGFIPKDFVVSVFGAVINGTDF